LIGSLVALMVFTDASVASAAAAVLMVRVDLAMVRWAARWPVCRRLFVRHCSVAASSAPGGSST